LSQDTGPTSASRQGHGLGHRLCDVTSPVYATSRNNGQDSEREVQATVVCISETRHAAPYKVLFKLAVTVHQCLNGRAPPYLSEHCIPVSHAAASAFRQPSPTCRTAFPAQHLRPSGVLRCWPDGLELTRAFYPGSNEQHRLFLGVYLKRTCSRVTSASNALGVLNDYALYKSTHSLTHSPYSYATSRHNGQVHVSEASERF